VYLSTFHPALEMKYETKQVECLYVGQISHRKGMAVLLQAARKLQSLPVKFRLIGPMVSPEVLADLPENVIYEGPSHPGGIADVMRQSDMFVLPTLEDAFALVVFEAMATGLPVVTTSHNGACEMIDAGANGLIIPAGDVDALAEAICRLVQSPELRRDLGAAARRKVQGAHSWEDYGKQVLEKIVARRQELGLGDGQYG
jgi:glycosyltransferase involved in cell wall biosynthesis